jgi:fatty-acyl-CoA synthase
MINASGFKIWPAEVEMLMHQHPDISEACVIGTPDDRRGETVKAYVVPGRDKSLTENGIIAWCQDNMAAYKCPRQIVFVESLPKNASGKVQWRDLVAAELTEARQTGT